MRVQATAESKRATGIVPPGDVAGQNRGVTIKNPVTRRPIDYTPAQKAQIKARILVPGPDGQIDNREPISDSRFAMVPFSAIGIIQVDFESGAPEQGTGFLVDPGIVLTAGHVLLSATKGWARRATFSAGCGLARRMEQTVDASRYRVAAAWDQDLQILEGDYGAIFLPDRAMYARCGRFEIAVVGRSFVDRHSRLGTPDFMVAGFPAEKPAGSLWIGGGPMIHPGSDASLRYRIDTTAGQSGAPVFGAILDSATRQRRPVAYAIHSRPASQEFNANEARRIDARVIDDLNRWAAEFGLQAAAVERPRR